MTGDGINHGTYGGYQKHRKLGVEACAECLAALVWYTRRRSESAELRAGHVRTCGSPAPTRPCTAPSTRKN